ncbi:DUF302 domain-containing protein [Kaarinaea lacus]
MQLSSHHNWPVYIVLLFCIPLWAGEASSPPNTPPIANDYVIIDKVEGEFAEIKEFLLLAISEHGIKISNTSYISKMLDRTAKEVGSDKKVFIHAEAIEFCSATLSRQMMENNPHNIAFCPYIIYIYELAQQPGIIYLGYRRPFFNASHNQDSSLAKVDEFLKNIISSVTE